jgi:hypothetical protein
VNCTDKRETRRETAGACQSHPAVIGILRRIDRERNVETIRQQIGTGALRPFDKNERAFRGFLPAEFGEFIRLGYPVKIGMDDGVGAAFIELHEGEGWARNLKGRIAQEVPDQRARKGRLARAEMPGQGQKIAGSDPFCDLRSESDGCRLVGKLQPPLSLLSWRALRRNRHFLTLFHDGHAANANAQFIRCRHGDCPKV